jgi:hypothetical protein
MTKIPSLEELREQYKDVMEDKAVTNISGWTEPNDDKPCDEQTYRDKAIANGQILHDKIKEVLAFE